MAISTREQDIQMMLAAKCHLGSKNCDFQMERYVHSRKDSDGVHIIDLNKTYEKLLLAARIIVAIENPQDIVVLSARPYGQRAVLKFAAYTGCKVLPGKHTAGTFTNQLQKQFEEPRLLIVTDPRVDHQPLLEASYVNIPTIAFAGTDSPLRNVDVAIPANNKGREAIGVLYYILAKQVLHMRGQLDYDQPWDVQVDLFFYKDPEEVKKEQEEEEAAGLVPDYGGIYDVPQDGAFKIDTAQYEAPVLGEGEAAPAAAAAFGTFEGGFEAAAAPATTTAVGGFGEAQPAQQQAPQAAAPTGFEQYGTTDFGGQFGA